MTLAIRALEEKETVTEAELDSFIESHDFPLVEGFLRLPLSFAAKSMPCT